VQKAKQIALLPIRLYIPYWLGEDLGQHVKGYITKSAQILICSIALLALNFVLWIGKRTALTTLSSSVKLSSNTLLTFLDLMFCYSECTTAHQHIIYEVPYVWQYFVAGGAMNPKPPKLTSPSAS
jgi:hypothetical protein